MIDIFLSKRNQKLLQSSSVDFFSAQNILITGASSGIGQSLAYACAAQGKNLFLWGRDENKLAETTEKCMEKGAHAYPFTVDLTHSEASLGTVNSILKNHSIDMAIFAAGSGDITKTGEILEDSSLLLNLMNLNYVTPSIMANKIAQQMIERHIKGHIVFIGSVAAFHSLPFATAYSSSKAGLSRFADSLRIALKKWKIHVTLITPGFIDTPMSQRLSCHKPFLIPLDKATTEIIKAVNTNQKQLIIPKPFRILKWIDLLSPDFVKDFILSHIKVKQD